MNQKQITDFRLALRPWRMKNCGVQIKTKCPHYDHDFHPSCIFVREINELTSGKNNADLVHSIKELYGYPGPCCAKRPISRFVAWLKKIFTRRER